MFAAAIGDRLTAGRRSAEDKDFFLAALKYAFKEKALPPVAGKRLVKGCATAFHHDKSAGRSSFSGEFFRTVPHSVAGRTIFCPLCSPHPQNQSEEKKTLSTQAFLPHFSCFRALAERAGRCYNGLRSAPPRARARSRARAEVRIRAGAGAAEFDPGEKRWKKTRWQVRC